MRVNDLTSDELKQLIRETVLEVLQDYLHNEELLDSSQTDPDAELEIRSEVREQLLAFRQQRGKKRVIPATEVAQRFDMTWQ